MARNLPLYARPAAALILPLTLLAAPVAAQTSVKEDSVVLQPDKVTDDAPEIETVAEANLPSWSVDNAKALLAFIQSAGDEGLFPKDYNPDALKAAIDGGNQITLDKVATDSFLLLATHMRDGRTPNAARKQWFMTDGDAQTEPLIPLLGSALTANDVAQALVSLDPVHPDFAVLKAALKTAKTPADANAIRVNMERWRWMPRDLGEGYVVSNVPEYLTRVVHDGVVIATHKAVVGKPSTPTPQLNPMATGIIVNPTWTLPRSIIGEMWGQLASGGAPDLDAAQEHHRRRHRIDDRDQSGARPRAGLYLDGQRQVAVGGAAAGCQQCAGRHEARNAEPARHLSARHPVEGRVRRRFARF